jgi:hypothetical protein
VCNPLARRANKSCHQHVVGLAGLYFHLAVVHSDDVDKALKAVVETQPSCVISRLASIIRVPSYRGCSTATPAVPRCDGHPLGLSLVGLDEIPPGGGGSTEVVIDLREDPARGRGTAVSSQDVLSPDSSRMAISAR